MLKLVDLLKEEYFEKINKLNNETAQYLILEILKKEDIMSLTYLDAAFLRTYLRIDLNNFNDCLKIKKNKKLII